MKSTAGTTALSALALLGATLLAGTPTTATAGTAPDAAQAVHTAQAAPAPRTAQDSRAQAARAEQDEPTDQQVMDAYQAEWGHTTVEPTSITDWVPLSTWDRAAQYTFAPGTDETTGTPAQESDLAPLRLDIVTRQAHGATEYQVKETADHPDGTQTVNYFPIFSGTPDAMTFYNAAGVPGLPAGESQQTCRALDSSGQRFLACRMIASDGSIHYQIKAEPGSTAQALPAIGDVLHAFRDQWGTDTFAPSGATAWKPVSQWERFKLFSFDEGEDEFTGTPEDADPAELRGLTLWMMTRTVGGEEQFMERGLARLEDGTTRDDGFAFGRFDGGPTDWFINQDGLDPSSGAEYRQHRRVVALDGQQLLVDRTLIPQADGGHSITYYVLRPVGQTS